MLRRAISYLVVLGVLLHAAAIVRHNTVMLEAHVLRASLVADLMVSCHPNGTNSVDPANLPDVPVPADAKNGCPICSGLAFALALPTPDLTPHFVAFDPPRLRPVIVVAHHALPRAILPPSRGPPSLA
ncbi:MAG: DUF2946 family protein [Hyphomicrobiaceae bacterium]